MVFQGCPVIFCGFLMVFCMVSYGVQYSSLWPHTWFPIVGFPSSFHWFSNGFPTVLMLLLVGFPRFPSVSPWFSLWVSYGFPWVPQIVSVAFPLVFHQFSCCFLWFSYAIPYGFPLALLMSPCGFLLVSLCFSLGCPVDSCWFPMVSPVVSYGFP